MPVVVHRVGATGVALDLARWAAPIVLALPVDAVGSGAALVLALLVITGSESVSNPRIPLLPISLSQSPQWRLSFWRFTQPSAPHCLKPEWHVVEDVTHAPLTHWRPVSHCRQPRLEDGIYAHIAVAVPTVEWISQNVDTSSHAVVIPATLRTVAAVAALSASALLVIGALL